MRKVLYLFVVLMLAGCADNMPQMIMYPHYAFRNSYFQEIVSIERTDTATVFRMKSFFLPNMWIRIAPGTYLTDGNEKYALLSAEGITPGEELFMGESGQADYTLFFEPIPPNTHFIHFIEGLNQDGAFNYYYINLSGKTPEAHAVLKLPKSLPEPTLGIGKTTVNFSFPFPLDGLDPIHLTLYVNTFLPGSPEEYELTTDADGKASISFDQYGPANAILACNQFAIAGPFAIDPGETVDIVADCSGRKQTIQNFSLSERPLNQGSINGRLAVVAHSEPLSQMEANYSFYCFDGTFASDAETAADYVKVVMDTYHAKQAALAANDSIPVLLQDYLDKYIKAEVVKAMNMAASIRKAQLSMEDARDGLEPAIFSDEDLSFLKELDLNDKRMLYIDGGKLTPELSLRIDPKANGWQGQAALAAPIIRNVESGKMLTNDEMDTLESLSEPIFKETALLLQQKAQEVLSRHSVNIKEIPVDSADPLSDILKQYTGKTVLVDFWATWCDPCRAAHKALEPQKDNRFKDVSFVYITDPTSPLPKWREMIEEIRGDHYYLTEEQWKRIGDQLDIYGIPAYLIVGKDGKIVNQFVGASNEVFDMLEMEL